MMPWCLSHFVKMIVVLHNTSLIKDPHAFGNDTVKMINRTF